MQQTIEVHVKLDAAVRNQPSATILFDLSFAGWVEVLAIEARRVCRGCEEAGPKEQHRSEGILARRASQCQPRAGVDDTVLLIEELVFAIAKPALLGIVEEEVGVVLMVVHLANDRDVLALDRAQDRHLGGDARLDLDLKAFLFGGTANRDELLQHALLPLNQKSVDPSRDV